MYNFLTKFIIGFLTFPIGIKKDFTEFKFFYESNNKLEKK